MNANDVTADTELMKIFVTGDYGTGKSVFAASFPTPGYLFDIDSGILTYRGMDWDYDQFPLSAIGWVAFEKSVRELEKTLKEDPTKYKTVVLDSTTTLADLAMERALQLDPKRSSTGGPLWNVHYQIIRNLMEGRLRQIINLPTNIVLISHLKIIEDNETGAILGTEPLLTGQLSTMIPGYFNEVYCTVVKNVKGNSEFMLRTITKGHYKARSRLSGKARLLPDEIPNDYNSLIELLKKSSNQK